jgi:hypothetical protein
MGGLAIPYYDLQSVNFVNPASYSRLRVTTLDFGIEYDARTLRENNPPNKFSSAYLIPTYFQLGLPLSKKGGWGMNIGFRPLTRINYDLENSTRLDGIDSVQYNYKGNGGSYQAFLGTGFGNRKFSIGVNAGYMFGSRQYSTRVNFISDSVRYRKTNSSDTTNFGGVFALVGLQYRIFLGGNTFLRLGATGSLQNTLNGSRDITRYTYENSVTSGIDILDSVYKESGIKGDIIYPASFGGGLMFEKEDKWLIGVEFNSTQWSDFRYYGEPGRVRDNWTLRLGGQLTPDVNSKSYWSRSTYRFGFSFGPDYVDLDQTFNQYLISVGASFPVRRNFYTNQYTNINWAVEFGARGNKSNNLRESLLKISLGLNLSDIWFNKRKYD